MTECWILDPLTCQGSERPLVRLLRREVQLEAGQVEKALPRLGAQNLHQPVVPLQPNLHTDVDESWTCQKVGTTTTKKVSVKNGRESGVWNAIK